MFECILPLWFFDVIEWFNNGVIDDQTMLGILKYFYNKGYCVEVEAI